MKLKLGLLSLILILLCSACDFGTFNNLNDQKTYYKNMNIKLTNNNVDLIIYNNEINVNLGMTYGSEREWIENNKNKIFDVYFCDGEYYFIEIKE